MVIDLRSHALCTGSGDDVEVLTMVKSMNCPQQPQMLTLNWTKPMCLARDRG
jgi:hypothetical protein